MDVLKTFGDYYAKKDYTNALLTLQKNPDALSSGILNYNLGTVYTKLENWPLARYHFLQAEGVGEASQNLDLIEIKLGLVKIEKPLNTSDYFFKTSSILSDGYLTTMSLLVLMLGLLIIKKTPSLKNIVLTFLIASLPFGFNFWVKSLPRAIALKTEPLLEGPSTIFGSAGELPAGVLVITKTQGEWKKIIYPSRFQGWIRSTDLKELE